MTELKMTTVTTNRVRYRDLNAFVREKLGWKKYDFQQVQECGNDSYFEFTISREENVDLDDEVITRWNAGEFVPYSNWEVMGYLCDMGLIPYGNYLIVVSW